jgi:serine protease AprX
VRGLALDYGAETVNAPSAWQYGYVGTGIGVAVIDSGVDAHADLGNGSNQQGSRVVYSESFIADPGTNDPFGHGTHVAGLIAGNGVASSGNSFRYTVRGIAPGANIINLRVLDERGNGSDSAVIAAISRATELKGRFNTRAVVAMSKDPKNSGR